jgi:formiminoglutamase
MVQLIDHHTLSPLFQSRGGEEKIGDVIALCKEWSLAAISAIDANFAIIGIPEDRGVLANNGIGGADTAWLAFLKSFLNLQSNQFLNGSDMLLCGHIATSNLTSVEAIDEVVEACIQLLLAANKIPIIIGGGHNNAYPIIRASSNFFKEAINVINLDPHADSRTTEARHSGNGFSFAKQANLLDRYVLLGLHQQYNNQYMLQTLKHFDYVPIWWEDVFLTHKYTWKEAVTIGKNVVKTKNYGVEIDMDSIEYALSSAMTPVGIDAQQAMYYLYAIADEEQACYLHIAEGIAQRADGITDPLTGKLISYLVQAFIKGKLKSFERN